MRPWVKGLEPFPCFWYSERMLALKLLPWRFIGPTLGVVLISLAAYQWAHGRGQRSRDNEVAVLITERDVARSNADLLEVAIRHQNAAVRLAEAKGVAAQDQAASALRMAQKRDKAIAGTKRRLEAAARPALPVADCVVSDAVTDAWGVMQ